MLNPNPQMLLRLCQADAYAHACEYIKFPRDEAILKAVLKFEGYVAHPIHLNLKSGWYTDDGAMSIAVSEVLLQKPPYTKQMFANAFVDVFQRDYRDGYARNFQAFLDTVKDGSDFLARVRPDSVKNGACMRAVPLGVLKTPKEVLDVAKLQASLTHDTEVGILSAQLVGLMSHLALYTDEPFDKFPKLILQITKDGAAAQILSTLWDGRPVTSRGGPGIALATVQAAFTAIVTSSNLIEVMQKVVSWGGDTDSVATIAWGIASTRFKEELDDFWYYKLEPGKKYGGPFLEQLGQKLMDYFNE